MRFELTITGFAVQSLWPDLATRATSFGPQMHADFTHRQKRPSLSQNFRSVFILQSVVNFGAEGEIRTLEARLEVSHVSSYITPANYWDSWQDSNPQQRRSKRRTLPVELQEQTLRSEICHLRSSWSGRTELNCHHEFPELGC